MVRRAGAKPLARSATIAPVLWAGGAPCPRGGVPPRGRVRVRVCRARGGSPLARAAARCAGSAWVGALLVGRGGWLESSGFRNTLRAFFRFQVPENRALPRRQKWAKYVFCPHGLVSKESWVRIADSKLGQNQGATPRRSPCSRGREPRPRFRDSTRARGAHTQEPDRIRRARAQVGPRARVQIPRLRSATRPKIPRLWGELTRFRRANTESGAGRNTTPLALLAGARTAP